MRFQYIYRDYYGRTWNYFRLLGLILLIFNPVLNIFAVYNKFL